MLSHIRCLLLIHHPFMYVVFYTQQTLRVAEAPEKNTHLPSAVLLTNFTPCITTKGLDTPARFYRFPITASIHYMCQTIYHDSTRSMWVFQCALLSLSICYFYCSRLMMITFLALAISLSLSLPIYFFCFVCLCIWMNIKKRACIDRKEGEIYDIKFFSHPYSGFCSELTITLQFIRKFRYTHTQNTRQRGFMWFVIRTARREEDKPVIIWLLLPMLLLLVGKEKEMGRNLFKEI